jgi:very-short-patch-repair endonuclease
MAGQMQRCSALAGARHQVISREQLLALGFTRHAVTHMLARGDLHLLFRGVYAVGRPDVTRRGWWMAGVLACGPGAVLSHTSAAELWRIRPGMGPIHVSAVAVRRPRGIVPHRRALAASDVALHHRIPVTTPIRTLIDIAPGRTRAEIEADVNEADRLGLVDPEELRAALGPHRGHAGIARLRDTLDRRTFTLTDSELERLFLPIARRAGLPRPLTQVYVNGFKVDFYFEELGLVVETDGLRYHRTPAQQARDRLRDQAHFAAGLIPPLRFTHGQIRYEPSHVHDVLAAAAARRGR